MPGDTRGRRRYIAGKEPAPDVAMLTTTLSTILRNHRLSALRGAALFLRGVLFLGHRYQCPCCGWRLRAFTTSSGVLATSESGYCPRCNAKARHRRLWLYLQSRTELFSAPVSLLDIAPWRSLARRLRRTQNIRHVGVDLRSGSGVSVVGDVAALPFASDRFDAALCIHVLEHVTADQRAMAELHRVLRPGGWAVVSVPIRLDQPTHEDPAVTDPAERARLFGERGHVRFYGRDFAERLQAAGFDVNMDPADGVPPAVRRRFGLRADENLFHCRRRAASAAAIAA